MGFGNVMSSIFTAYGRTPHELAIFAFYGLIGALTGATITGIILDKT